MGYPTDDGLISVASTDRGASYEWDLTEVWYNPTDRKYYVYSGGGCSCNWAYGYYEGLADLDGPMTFAQAISGLDADGKSQAMQWKEPI